MAAGTYEDKLNSCLSLSMSNLNAMGTQEKLVSSHIFALVHELKCLVSCTNLQSYLISIFEILCRISPMGCAKPESCRRIPEKLFSLAKLTQDRATVLSTVHDRIWVFCLKSLPTTFSKANVQQQANVQQWPYRKQSLEDKAPEKNNPIHLRCDYFYKVMIKAITLA